MNIAMNVKVSTVIYCGTSKRSKKKIKMNFYHSLHLLHINPEESGEEC